jgi:hypothetical protein
MTRKALIEEFRAERPELGPDAMPAIVEEPSGPVPDYRDALVGCRCCDRPLASNEYDADFDYEGPETGYTFCGRDTCRDCDHA